MLLLVVILLVVGLIEGHELQLVVLWFGYDYLNLPQESPCPEHKNRAQHDAARI